MDINLIKSKFGDEYLADENTFMMGIDQRFSRHFAERFGGLRVLETCTGAGFTTISLAKTAKHVVTVEVSEEHQKQAVYNIGKAGLAKAVTFIKGDILDSSIIDNLPPIDAAFIDPDWAVSGPDHIYRFKNSNTLPPADILFRKVYNITKNVAIILPPLIDVNELNDLPSHECEKLFLGKSLELYCLYFGHLKRKSGDSFFYI